jgi:hypothetical protein
MEYKISGGLLPPLNLTGLIEYVRNMDISGD